MRSATLAILVLSLIACNHSKQAAPQAAASPAVPDNWGVHANIASWGNGAPSIDIQVPVEWKYERHSPADFDLNYFIDPAGSGSLFIYVGHHPKTDIDPKATKVRLNVGGLSADFSVSNLDGVRKTQAIIPGFYPKNASGGVSDLKLHIVINENKIGFTDNAIKALSTMRLSKRT